jgi:hypothetical protein
LTNSVKRGVALPWDQQSGVLYRMGLPFLIIDELSEDRITLLRTQHCRLPLRDGLVKAGGTLTLLTISRVAGPTPYIFSVFSLFFCPPCRRRSRIPAEKDHPRPRRPPGDGRLEVRHHVRGDKPVVVTS